MLTRIVAILWLASLLVVNTSAGEVAVSADAVELARYEKDFSSAHVEPARMDGRKGVAVVFEGTKGLHYYADAETAPAEGLELKIQAKAKSVDFGEAVFPKSDIFQDPLGNKVDVYAGQFIVFVPIKTDIASTKVGSGDVEIVVAGITCTDMICLAPFEKTLHAKIDLSQSDSWKQISFEKAVTKAATIADGPNYSALFALGLALLAGLSLNIMPCIWPILPIIVMRLVEQAKAGKGKTFSMGLGFCLGILLFFACLAGANIILQVFYGTVLQWGDQFRNPAFVAGMALLLVVLALFMFGVFTITVPSAISGKSTSGKGRAGVVGMGFLAAILSTPCSFAILAAAFAWAQAQPLPLATLAIMVIGVGMTLPYAILTSMPGLVNRLPRPGGWMELFKQTIGFILLIIAVKLISALPELRRTNVLYFAVMLSFTVWMWGGWVSFGSKLSRKLFVRGLAVVLAVSFGWLFLKAPPVSMIKWQGYDAVVIDKALAEDRPVLIKFTADWCISCQVVEKTVYARKDIAELIDSKGVLAIKADTTVKDYPATIALKNIYNEPGVPVSILFMPGQKKPVRWRGMTFADELEKLLEEL